MAATSLSANVAAQRLRQKRRHSVSDAGRGARARTAKQSFLSSSKNSGFNLCFSSPHFFLKMFCRHLNVLLKTKIEKSSLGPLSNTYPECVHTLRTSYYTSKDLSYKCTYSSVQRYMHKDVYCINTLAIIYQ